MGRKRAVGFTGLTAALIYAGVVLGNVIRIKYNINEARNIVASESYSHELRDAAGNYVKRLEDSLRIVEVLNPFQIPERPPYEPVYQLRGKYPF